ncbi:MAG: hypothetical protein KME42_26325 [Tildeniella nuda ZEHNDER 1965/U140]|jgi:hypothetical protein|nr:hypothetical protein [Tildeniella nuda ZEHNDER 1965/U140]
MNSEHSDQHIVPHDSILLYRRGVWFESQALWNEKDPVCRANIARLLAEMTVKLAEMEAEEAQKFLEQTASSDVA